MKPTKQPFPTAAALAVQSRFELWRQSRPKRVPIPDELWQAAIELAREYNVYKVARLLRLDYSCLKKKVENGSMSLSRLEEPKAISFFELPQISQKSPESCRIELKRPDGTAMQICLSDMPDTDLCGLIKAFIH